MTDGRELISRANLNDRLTAELQKVEDATDSRLSVQFLLKEPDEDGCNWSDEFVLSVGPNATAEYLLPIAANLVRAARAKYNIMED